MWWLAAGWVMLGIAILLAIVCDARLFFAGRPGGVVDLGGVYFAGQWLALGLAAAAAATLGVRGSRPGLWIGLGLLMWLVATGVPHPARRREWHQNRNGAAVFLRAAISEHQKRQAPRERIRKLAGVWRAPDGRR